MQIADQVAADAQGRAHVDHGVGSGRTGVERIGDRDELEDRAQLERTRRHLVEAGCFERLAGARGIEFRHRGCREDLAGRCVEDDAGGARGSIVPGGAHEFVFEGELHANVERQLDRHLGRRLCPQYRLDADRLVDEFLDAGNAAIVDRDAADDVAG